MYPYESSSIDWDDAGAVPLSRGIYTLTTSPNEVIGKNDQLAVAARRRTAVTLALNNNNNDDQWHSSESLSSA